MNGQLAIANSGIGWLLPAAPQPHAAASSKQQLEDVDVRAELAFVRSNHDEVWIVLKSVPYPPPVWRLTLDDLHVAASTVSDVGLALRCRCPPLPNQGVQCRCRL